MKLTNYIAMRKLTAYSDDQPRDDNGRFASDGGGGGAKSEGDEKAPEGARKDTLNDPGDWKRQTRFEDRGTGTAAITRRVGGILWRDEKNQSKWTSIRDIKEGRVPKGMPRTAIDHAHGKDVKD